jgi:hypothetical protein
LLFFYPLRFRSERFSGPVNKERIRSLGGSVVNQSFSMQEGRPERKKICCSRAPSPAATNFFPPEHRSH